MNLDDTHAGIKKVETNNTSMWTVFQPIKIKREELRSLIQIGSKLTAEAVKREAGQSDHLRCLRHEVLRGDQWCSEFIFIAHEESDHENDPSCSTGRGT